MRWVVLLVLLPLQAAIAGDTSIQGRLLVEEGKPPRLVYGDRKVILSSGDESVRRTLQDTRISEKVLKLEGRFLEDGSFQADRFFVIRAGGDPVRLVYFCRICNITTFSPGDCVCCQAPTVPTEIPLSDPRVRQDEVERSRRP
jgi:hypothetical protein